MANLKTHQRYKRMLSIHLLNIPIEKPYGFVFDILLEFLRPDKIVLIIDSDGGKNKCLVDKHGNIIYTLYHYHKDNSSIIMNYHYSVYMKKLKTGILNEHIEEMAWCVLNYYKVEFDEFYSLPMLGFDENFFIDLKKKFDSGDFELSNF